MASMCVCFSIRNQVYCNYYAVGVGKPPKIVVFLLSRKVLMPLCLQVKACFGLKALVSFLQRNPMLSRHSWHFSRIHPVVGSRQSPCLLSTSDVSPKLFISAQWYNRLPQTMRGSCARTHSRSERRPSITACLWCLLLCLNWSSVMVPGWMIIRGPLSWTSQTWMKILHFSCETWHLKKNKKTKPKTGCLFIWALKVSLTWPSLWPYRWK